jgi:cell filamentation protein
MSNSYKYLDFEYTYNDPKTGILKNLLDITDADTLLFVESAAVTKRLQKLNLKPIKIKGVFKTFSFRKGINSILIHLIIKMFTKDI